MPVSLSCPLLIIIIWKKQKKYKKIASHCAFGPVWLGKSHINVQVEALQKTQSTENQYLLWWNKMTLKVIDNQCIPDSLPTEPLGNSFYPDKGC